jgi:predicted metalloprotease
MRVRGVVVAVAVPAIVIGVIGLVVIQTEDSLSGRSHGAMESAAIAQPVDASAATKAAPAAEAAGAPAAVAPESKAAPQPRAVPARVTFAEYSALQRSILGAVDGWWTTALHRAGLSYTGPHITIAGQGKHAMSECGRAVAAPRDSRNAYPAFYCRGDRTVYLSSGWLYDVIYANFHRGGVAAIIAHEYGHHVQHSIGIADPKVSRQELQADCLAGVWMRSAVASGSYNAGDVKDARRALRALGDTKMSSKLHHGTPTERMAWFDRGYATGDAYTCNN